MPAVLPTPATLTPLTQSCGSPQSSEYVMLRPLRERISGPLPLPSMSVTWWVAGSNVHVDDAEAMAGAAANVAPASAAPTTRRLRECFTGSSLGWGAREGTAAPLRSLSASLGHGDGELRREAAAALRRHVQRARAVGPAQPVERQQPVGQRAPDCARQVVGLLAPVHAVAQRPHAAPLHAEPLELLDPGLGEPVLEVAPARRQAVPAAVAVAPVAARDRAARDQRLHDRHAEPAGDVVVARARVAHEVRARVLAQRADRRGRREPRQHLDQLAHLGAGEPVVAMAAL